ncbi:MAG: hypothetical protein DHS20C15_26870 [Planctomycetota bacterium]|nr:MAG: hypothetical protein DHS20C15_26870 [Planctomycetota bacterium]
MRRSTILLAVLVLGARAFAQDPSPPNVLLILADDLGIDRVAAYGAHPDPGNTPVIDQLAREGVLFRNAWANPFCTSSRATILTGRYSMRTGLGSITSPSSGSQLALSELTLPEALPVAYRNAAVGKWHLAAGNAPEASLLHPMESGFEHHRGSIGNLPSADGESAYFHWQKNVDGALQTSTTYATTDAVDEALGFIEQWSAKEEPWFLWLAFNAPHKPFHAPPAELHSVELPDVIDPPLHMRALTEAMDTEIGRLLAELDPAVRANTYVIFLGDNGTLDAATTAPFLQNHAKGTVFNGGVHVPLIVTGPGVPAGDECAALVNSTDLFATVLELAGELSQAEDSISLLPYLQDPSTPSLRPWIYAERFTPDHTVNFLVRHQAIRDARFKLRRIEGNGQVLVEGLSDVLADFHESTDLLSAPLDDAAAAAYAKLGALLSAKLQPLVNVTWRPLGFASPGSAGVARLHGQGSLQADTRATLSLRGALPDTPAALVTGFAPLVATFKSGSLIPTPDVVRWLAVDAAGEARLELRWPAGVDADTSFYFQAWQPDPGAPSGFNGSAALAATTPLP